MKEITSIKNQLIIETAKLKQKKYRQDKRKFLIEGEHLIKEAYEAGLLEIVFHLGQDLPYEIESYLVTEEIIQKLSDVSSPQGLIGVCHFPQESHISKQVLLCDGIQDPGNMGTLIRSALAFGFESLVVDHCVDVYNPKVIRSTQGALFKINIIEDNIIDFMDKHPIHYYATDLSAQGQFEKKHHEEFGLILGNEGQGVDPEIINKADSVIKLKMKKVESLNVAVAGSILMYELGGNR